MQRLNEDRIIELLTEVEQEFGTDSDVFSRVAVEAEGYLEEPTPEQLTAFFRAVARYRGSIEARDAVPGHYFGKSNQRIEVVDYESSAWPEAPTNDRIPFRRAGDPEAPTAGKQIDLHGWLPPNYVLVPMEECE